MTSSSVGKNSTASNYYLDLVIDWTLSGIDFRWVDNIQEKNFWNILKIRAPLKWAAMLNFSIMIIISTVSNAATYLYLFYHLIVFLEMVASNVETMLPCKEECKKLLSVLEWLVSSMASINFLFHVKNIIIRMKIIGTVVLRLTRGHSLFSLFNRP